MTTLAMVNIGSMASGRLDAPRIEADALVVRDGRIAALGRAAEMDVTADVVVDCRGTTVLPGLIDSHCHVVLGDYTPRQKTVDFLDWCRPARGCTLPGGRTTPWRPRLWPSRRPSASRTFIPTA
jgi:hypothetical protein